MWISEKPSVSIFLKRKLLTETECFYCALWSFEYSVTWGGGAEWKDETLECF